ncbi:UNKNOWN [Stylonychia lemnae]|uniref:Uncharacterized protein n=1 Tax=Stylonychia lemnae TaxID=5949 RepID=A0A078AGH0_STYLE|nr:UNKNOWN [Stylonychia lemnae]|eukprot:CDW80911.1 UNKNOWN [Stylonychia lemnae]
MFLSDSQTLESYESDNVPIHSNEVERSFLIADLALQSKRYDEALLEILSIQDFYQQDLSENQKNILYSSFASIMNQSYMYRLKSLKIYGQGSQDKLQVLFDTSSKYYEKCIVESVRLHPINPIRLQAIINYSEFHIEYNKDQQKVIQAIQQEKIWYDEAFSLYHSDKDQQLTFEQDRESFKLLSQLNSRVMSHQYLLNNKSL